MDEQITLGPEPSCDPTRASYDQMAVFYDDFSAHHDYELWLSRLLPAAKTCGLSGNRLLDVGCGTGKSFLPLVGTQWQITACDLSKAMVDQARRKVGPQVRLVVADMRDLPVLGAFDLVWSLGDAINYMRTREELVIALRGMRRNLAVDGLLLFDVNTLRTYRTFYADTQVLERDGRRLIWRGLAHQGFQPTDEARSVFEVQQPNGTGFTTRLQVVHSQRHFPTDGVADTLRQAGFECLAAFGHGFDACLEQPVDEERHTKAIFIARAKPESEGR